MVEHHEEPTLRVETKIFDVNFKLSDSDGSIGTYREHERVLFQVGTKVVGGKALQYVKRGALRAAVESADLANRVG